MYIAPLTRQSAPVFCAEDAIFRRCVIFATCDLPSLSHAEERGQLPRSQLSLPKTPSKIHGELLKLGIEVAQSTVSIYMVPSTTLAVWSGTGLNEAADAAVERSLEVDARAPGGARAGWPE